MDRREYPRFQTPFTALCSAGREEGRGALVNISYSGALLDGISLRPTLGTEVIMHVLAQPVSSVELVGHVARHTESGFAIKFVVTSSELCRLVDDVRAIVSH